MRKEDRNAGRDRSWLAVLATLAIALAATGWEAAATEPTAAPEAPVTEGGIELPGPALPDELEPCDEFNDADYCQPVFAQVQSRGTMVPPLIPFRLKSEGVNLCLQPDGLETNRVVRAVACANRSSQYWDAVNGNQNSNIPGAWGARWQYAVRNRASGHCLALANPTGTNSTLVQVSCGPRFNPNTNFVPSPHSPIGGEFVVVSGRCIHRHDNANTRSLLIQQTPQTQAADAHSNSNYTWPCTNYQSLRWHRSPL